MKNKKYIAGPMTGYKNYNFERFYSVEKMLYVKGIDVVNPARITDEYGGQKKFLEDETIMKKVLDEQQRLIKEECDEIILLEGWNKSKGSLIELKLALENNLKISLISEYL